MIGTGYSTTFDFVKYLASIRSTLTPQEVRRLREIPAFLKEVAGKEQPAAGIRHKARDLYEPLEIFREFGLPIIDWGADNEWRALSDEGKFLMRCCRRPE